MAAPRHPRESPSRAVKSRLIAGRYFWREESIQWLNGPWIDESG
jgi:hypothetical protein